jgi:hypothetical protein
MTPVMSYHVLGASVPGNERKSYEDQDPIGFVVSYRTVIGLKIFILPRGFSKTWGAGRPFDVYVYATFAVKNMFERTFVSPVIVTVFVVPPKLGDMFVIQFIAAVFSDGMSCGVAMLYTL